MTWVVKVVILELNREVNKLLAEAGQPAHYASAAEVKFIE